MPACRAADPIFSSCASGSGSAGGSNTQVQFNNSTALGGSVNLTWVSPALTIGVAGTTGGQLQLLAGSVSGTVTIQNPFLDDIGLQFQPADHGK